MDSLQILDHHIVVNQKPFKVKPLIAPRRRRLVHMLVDTCVFYFLTCVFYLFINKLEAASILSHYLFQDFWSGYAVIMVIKFIYYWLMEYLFGQTLGKMITRTKVVNMQGQKPSALRLLARTASRFIPFDSFSFVIERAGWHDTAADTRVIRIV
jgi:uncharacterized RDD family membrane protein YckC